MNDIAVHKLLGRLENIQTLSPPLFAGMAALCDGPVSVIAAFVDQTISIYLYLQGISMMIRSRESIFRHKGHKAHEGIKIHKPGGLRRANR
ncbi:MAG: hypothetical protein P8X96_22765 [Desulfobacteraceae bacterium]